MVYEFKVSTKEVKIGPEGPGPELVLGVRACYFHRGSYGFGKVLRINKKTVLLDDEKNNSGEILVSKVLLYKLVIF